jgi:hypothetical protein
VCLANIRNYQSLLIVWSHQKDGAENSSWLCKNNRKAKSTGKPEMDWILQGKKSSSAGNNTLKVETMNF